MVSKELELWQFIASRLKKGEAVMLLVVAESSGSSPGRQGYKMAIGADGRLCGSIGGGVMEMRLVEKSRALLSEPGAIATGLRTSLLTEQVHKKAVSNASGMICSGKQIVILNLLEPDNAEVVEGIIAGVNTREPNTLTLGPGELCVGRPEVGNVGDYLFETSGESRFVYKERLGKKNHLYIFGGGHCALALSEMMSKLDFYVYIFDDRPELNTIEKNRFADEAFIIESYENIGNLIPSGLKTYVVVMTLGYKYDEVVIRTLFEKDFRYFGVLGSKAKMKTLIKSLEREGLAKDRLARIRTPIGLPINSHSPEEIAVSIAAEIISVKNAKPIK